MAYKDDELTLEELDEITAGIKKGEIDDMLNKLSIKELEQFKETIMPEKELTEEELENVRAGIPLDVIEQLKNKK